jgi:flagellar biosynthesis/type III secretory pathway protein FliH
MSAPRPLFQSQPAASDVRPLVERLPAVTSPRAALPISAAAPVARPLFGAATPRRTGNTNAPATAPAGPDPAALQREIAAARADAERAARAAVAAEAEVTLHRYLGTIKALDRAVQQVARPPVNEVVELAMIVAQEIIGRELASDRSRVATAIEDALSQAGDEHQGAVVRVNPEDLAYVHANHGERFPGVELIADPRLQSGGCVVETSRAVVDASIEARMAAVRRAVQVALADEAA